MTSGSLGPAPSQANGYFQLGSKTIRRIRVRVPSILCAPYFNLRFRLCQGLKWRNGVERGLSLNLVEVGGVLICSVCSNHDVVVVGIYVDLPSSTCLVKSSLDNFKQND